MREDYEEALNKMFPNGYCILFAQPNRDYAYHWYNPNQEEFFNEYLAMLNMCFFSDEEGESNGC